MTTTGHEKCCVMVELAAKGDGTKLKYFLVLKGGNCDAEKLKKEYGNKSIIASSTSGWMDTDLTLSGGNAVLWQYSFAPLLLTWYTYECHLMPVIKASLNAKKIDTVLMPGCCTKYIQAPDVSWNKPFKAISIEKFDKQHEAVGPHQEADAGNLKPVPRSTIVNWILDS